MNNKTNPHFTKIKNAQFAYLLKVINDNRNYAIESLRRGKISEEELEKLIGHLGALSEAVIDSTNAYYDERVYG